jgi:hypothetical protein
MGCACGNIHKGMYCIMYMDLRMHAARGVIQLEVRDTGESFFGIVRFFMAEEGLIYLHILSCIFIHILNILFNIFCNILCTLNSITYYAYSAYNYHILLCMFFLHILHIVILCILGNF